MADKYWLDVARGFIPGISLTKVSFQGRPTAGTGLADLWSVGGPYPFLSSGVPLNIMSTNVQDSGGGWGVGEISILGLNESYVEISENINISGTDTVTTSNNFFRVLDVNVVSVGLSGTNMGNLQGSGTFGDGFQFEMVKDKSASLASFYTVPSGKTGYITDMTISIFSSLWGGSQNTRADLYTKDVDGIQKFQTSFYVNNEGGGTLQLDNVHLEPIVEKTDVFLKNRPESTNVITAGYYNLILVDNN